MTKYALAFLIVLLTLMSAAIAQAPPSSVNAQYNKAKNVWAGDNFEQVCTIAATGSPGTFTPACPSNNITITASGQTIALPVVGTPPGYQPGGVTKSVELNIFYSSPFIPGFATGYGWVNQVAPVLCTSGGAGCLSGVVGPNPDVIECRTVSETVVRCGAPLTAIGPPAPYAVVAQSSCNSVSGAACTTGATNMTGATLILGCLGYYNGSGASSTVSDSLGNSPTQLYAITSGTLTSKMFYYKPPSVSGSMTFTASNTGGGADASPGLTIMGFSGPFTTPLDQSASTPSSGSVTSQSSGSITPSQANTLLGTCLGVATGETGGIGIASPFILGPVAGAIGGSSYGSALAYQFQNAIAAANGTWSWTGAAVAGAGVGNFH